MGTNGEYLFVNNTRIHDDTTQVAAEFDGRNVLWQLITNIVLNMRQEVVLYG
jgi:hypothetical protein